MTTPSKAERLEYHSHRHRHFAERGMAFEAEAEMLAVDAILDEPDPVVVAVASDGEAIYSTASPWVRDQARTDEQIIDDDRAMLGLTED